MLINQPISIPRGHKCSPTFSLLLSRPSTQTGPAPTNQSGDCSHCAAQFQRRPAQGQAAGNPPFSKSGSAHFQPRPISTFPSSRRAAQGKVLNASQFTKVAGMRRQPVKLRAQDVSRPCAGACPRHPRHPVPQPSPLIFSSPAPLPRQLYPDIPKRPMSAFFLWAEVSRRKHPVSPSHTFRL